MLSVIISSSVFYFIYDNMKPLSANGKPITFVVKRGDSLSLISNELEDYGIVKNSKVFKYYGVYKKYDQKIKEGKYEISSSMDISEIYNILIEGKQNLISVTIPEGYTSSKIAELLERKAIVSKDEFLDSIKDKRLLDLYSIPFDSADGFLFPDTYSFEENYPAVLVVESFIKNFYKNMGKIYPSYKKLTKKQLADKVVLASIVEREYKSRSEIKTIASVFYNRLSKKMKLESCATIMYILTEERKEDHRDRLLFADLKIESEFNTYLNKGLPPKAISNPGFYALDAVFYPAETNYIFFVVKDRSQGLHTFSSNYNEHEEARLQYISGFESKK